MENIQTSFLGQGWGFPPTFTRAEKGVGLVADEKDVEESLQILLSTRLNERVMRLDYGCNLDQLLFESITTNLENYIVDLVKTALRNYEPRIEVEKVKLDTVNRYDGVILIKIDYRIRQTNTRYNLVYPFYIDEATNIDTSNL